MVYLSAKWFIILLNSSSIWLQMYKEIQTNCGQRQWHCAKDPFQMELKVKIGTKVIFKYNVNTSDGLKNGARGDLLGINSINYRGRNPQDMAQRGQRLRAAKVITHQHPKPVAHPTMLDHVAMPDHMGNGKARPLTEASPVEHLEERPTEAAHMGHRTTPPSNRPSSKNPL